MAVPNLSEIATTTMRNRSRKVEDNISNAAVLLMKLRERGGRSYDPVDGGETILQELMFATNTNVGWYSGYDTLPTGTNDTMSAAEFSLKQCACPVVWSGLEELKNAGKEKAIDLVARRIDVAEISMRNLISQSLYSDGTAHGGKEIVGVLGMCPVDGTTGTYGSINRATYSFWQPYNLDTNAAPSSSTIQAKFTTAMLNLTMPGSPNDKPDLIVCDNDVYAAYLASLQTLQRFTQTKTAETGFESTKFMGAEVVCDEGINGYVTDVTAYFLNTRYIHWRPHKERNFVPIGGDRMAFNQDATARVLGFAGALTCSASRNQGQIIFS